MTGLAFVDKQGNKKLLGKQAQKMWLQTFGLDSIDDIYTPKCSNEIKKALQGKDIRLTKGSLLKLAQKDRLQYILQIKQTLDNPDIITYHYENVIFAKNINERIFFTSVGREFESGLVIISNAPKKSNTIKNKIKSGKIVYQSPKFEHLRYNQTFTDERLIINEIDKKDSI